MESLRDAASKLTIVKDEMVNNQEQARCREGVHGSEVDVVIYFTDVDRRR